MLGGEGRIFLARERTTEPGQRYGEPTGRMEGLHGKIVKAHHLGKPGWSLELRLSSSEQEHINQRSANYGP